jgi:hypothetical protein
MGGYSKGFCTFYFDLVISPIKLADRHHQASRDGRQCFPIGQWYARARDSDGSGRSAGDLMLRAKMGERESKVNRDGSKKKLVIGSGIGIVSSVYSCDGPTRCPKSALPILPCHGHQQFLDFSFRTHLSGKARPRQETLLAAVTRIKMSWQFLGIYTRGFGFDSSTSL